MINIKLSQKHHASLFIGTRRYVYNIGFPDAKDSTIWKKFMIWIKGDRIEVELFFWGFYLWFRGAKKVYFGKIGKL